MHVRPFTSRPVLVAAAAALFLGALGTGTAGQPVHPVAAVSTPTASAADAIAALQEFRTPNNAGWFYTLNPGEAASATWRFGFTKSANIGSLHTSPRSDTTAVHRLRLRDGGPSYMLSISSAEIGDPRFVDEGVLGYVDGGQHPGQARLLRFSNHGQWRVLSDAAGNINNMAAEGYVVDGPLGWFNP